MGRGFPADWEHRRKPKGHALLCGNSLRTSTTKSYLESWALASSSQCKHRFWTQLYITSRCWKEERNQHLELFERKTAWKFLSKWLSIDFHRSQVSTHFVCPKTLGLCHILHGFVDENLQRKVPYSFHHLHQQNRPEPCLQWNKRWNHHWNRRRNNDMEVSDWSNGSFNSWPVNKLFFHAVWLGDVISAW